MPKERNYNPVQAQRKADKAKAIKKGKADVAAARNERLAKRNPDRIRKQIDDLKAITEGGGKLTAHEEQVLEGLEKEIKAVTKARDALGDKAPTFGRGGSSQYDHGRRDGFGKKRRRDNEDDSSGDSDVPEDVRSIPMPRDTPPPVPKKYLDEWYAKRRARRNANTEPLGEGRNGGRGEDRSNASAKGTTSSAAAPHATSTKPVEAKTVYEAKAVVRDLQKEAVTAFVPTVVLRKLDKSRGLGGLLEPEEADRLEKEGYLKNSVPVDGSNGGRDASVGGDSSKEKTRGNSGQWQQPHSPQKPTKGRPGPHRATVEDADDDEEG